MIEKFVLSKLIIRNLIEKIPKNHNEVMPKSLNEVLPKNQKYFLQKVQLDALRLYLAFIVLCIY